MRLSIAALLLLVACGEGALPPVGDTSPVAPSKDDTGAFTVAGARPWYVAGNALTASDRLALAITGPADTQVVDLWLDGRFVARAELHDGEGRFDLDLADVAIGAHTALLAADGAPVAFAAVRFQRSHPLYVAVSNDWDTADNGDAMLERQERLHARHPHLLLTHFVGPYTFTDPSVSATRRAQLVDWVTNLRETEGDEIGLHVHPYCNFVETAGVTCRTAPSFARASDATGYTVILASYTEAELARIFLRARELFEQHGLGTPTSFRAGGWTADTNVLKALATAGHVADSRAPATGRASRSGPTTPAPSSIRGTASSGRRSMTRASPTTPPRTTSSPTASRTCPCSRSPTTVRSSITSRAPR